MIRLEIADDVGVRTTIAMSWSSGKDSAWALDVLRRDEGVAVVGALTTITKTFGRVSMHGVREEVLDAQIERLAIPMTKVKIPSPCSNAVYEQTMGEVVTKLKQDGVEAVAFGDLFLEDIRAYREGNMRKAGLDCLFPLWGRDTATLSREMVDSGLIAIITCLDPKVMPREFAGRIYDHDFLDDLPEHVDPCGEHGEFHTVVVSGPMFRAPIPVEIGETVERDGFVFTDVSVEQQSQP